MAHGPDDALHVWQKCKEAFQMPFQQRVLWSPVFEILGLVRRWGSARVVFKHGNGPLIAAFVALLITVSFVMLLHPACRWSHRQCNHWCLSKMEITWIGMTKMEFTKSGGLNAETSMFGILCKYCTTESLGLHLPVPRNLWGFTCQSLEFQLQIAGISSFMLVNNNSTTVRIASQWQTTDAWKCVCPLFAGEKLVWTVNLWTWCHKILGRK